MTLPPLRFVVPVHNDAEVIAQTVETLATELARRPPPSGRHEIALVENGSADASWEVAEALAGEHGGVRVRAFREPAAGLGYALARGTRELLAGEGDPSSFWIALTGSDLPFGFTDLDAFEAWHARSPRGRIAIGSKAHRDSVVPTTPLRTVMSTVFRAARYALVGMRTGDSQGTFFVRGDLMAEHHERIVARDYFWTTELVYWSERAKEPIEELPVRIAPQRRPSTVRPFKHGSRMFRALLELRARRH
jgi:glycosyltransferase involved in cell wall biosynthesis